MSGAECTTAVVVGLKSHMVTLSSVCVCKECPLLTSGITGQDSADSQTERQTQGGSHRTVHRSGQALLKYQGEVPAQLENKRSKFKIT